MLLTLMTFTMNNNINDLLEVSKKIECKECGCNLFIPGYFLLDIPAAIADNGIGGVGPTLITFICSECGEAYQQTNTNEEN